MKEKFCEKYFENKVLPKHLSDFEAETPQGNVIRGYICRKKAVFGFINYNGKECQEL